MRLNKLSRSVILVKLFATAVVAWGLGIAVSAFVGGFFNWTGYCKPFYSYPFLAIVLFGLPVLFTQALVYSIFWKGSQRKSWLAGKFTMAIVLMIGAYITRTVYILCLHIFFAILAWFPRPLYKRKLRNYDDYRTMAQGKPIKIRVSHCRPENARSHGGLRYPHWRSDSIYILIISGNFSFRFLRANNGTEWMAYRFERLPFRHLGSCPQLHCVQWHQCISGKAKEDCIAFCSSFQYFLVESGDCGGVYWKNPVPGEDSHANSASCNAY